MRLVLDARARALLRRFPVTTVYSGLELLLIAALAVQGARLLWTVVTPVGPIGDWRPAQPVLGGSPTTLLKGFDPFFRLSGGDPDKPAVVTSLHLTLYGIRIDEAQGGGSAIIAGPDNIQQSVGVGQEIMPGVRLKAVAFDHVTIDRGGAVEDLFLAQGDGETPAPPVTTSAGPPLMGGGAAAVAGPPAAPSATGISVRQLRTDIGFIPRVDNGRISGLVVRPQGSGAAFRASGLHEGDVVTAIGGKAITGPGDFDNLGAQFAKGGNLSITVERGSAILPLAMTIAGP